MSSRAFFLVVLCLVVVVGCGAQTEAPTAASWVRFPTTENYQLSEAVEDDEPAFPIVLTEPFWIELGRGSSEHGLETVKVAQDGWVEVHRKVDARGERWERTSFRLSPEVVVAVAEAVEGHWLLHLHKAYHAGGVEGGSQW